MSAFALRKRLLATQTTNSPATTTEPVHVNDAAVLTAQPTQSQTEDTAIPRKSRRIRLAREASKHEENPESGSAVSLQADRTPEKTLASDPISPLPVESAPTLSDIGVPIEPSSILLSNFKPSRNNYQRRKDGRIHLKLVDGEVCYPIIHPSRVK